MYYLSHGAECNMRNIFRVIFVSVILHEPEKRKKYFHIARIRRAITSLSFSTKEAMFIFIQKETFSYIYGHPFKSLSSNMTIANQTTKLFMFLLFNTNILSYNNKVTTFENVIEVLLYSPSLKI